jgi:hypothetical protein
MDIRYIAHGLDLRCDFALPGMTPAGEEAVPACALPSVTLHIDSVAQLADRWSGPHDAPLWRGRLGDGCELTIERGADDDTLFTYGQRARFHLDASRSSLTCVPRASGLHWQRTLLTKVLADVSLLRGHEALHASAVDSPHGAVAMVAPPGAGKTTLALELMRRGHRLLADDVLTLADGPHGPVAHGASPHMNLAAEHHAAATPLVDTLGRLANERWVAARDVVQGPRAVHLICLLERRSGRELGVEPLGSGPLALAPYMLGLEDGLLRERARFALYAELASSATLLRLSCDNRDSPAEIADLVELAATDAPALAAGGSLA